MMMMHQEVAGNNDAGPRAMSNATCQLDRSIPMADSIMLATARAWNAMLWSQDADFAKIPGVRFVGKRGTGRAG